MTAQATTTNVEARDTALLERVLREGYGPGAWHGADLRAALAGLSAKEAMKRPGPGRHNAAEIAVHHAFTVRNVIARLSGAEPDAFPLDGEDWFPIDEERGLPWPSIVALVEAQQRRLTEVVTGIGAGTIASPLSATERFELVLGVTCHAVYHAGQVQLIRVLTAGMA